MISYIKKINYIVPAMIISLIYLFFPSGVRNPLLQVIIIISWLIAFILIPVSNIIMKLVTMLILTLPVSFVSIFGTGHGSDSLNWFLIFSVILFTTLIISLYYHRSKIKLDTFSYLLIASLSFLALSFLNNLAVETNRSTQQYFLIFYLLSFILVFYLTTKINPIDNQRDIEPLLSTYSIITTLIGLSVILQFILFQFNIIIGRIEVFYGPRFAFGYLNFDYSFLSLLLVSNLFYTIKEIRLSGIKSSSSFIFIVAIVSSYITSARTGLTAFFVLFLLIILHLILLRNNFSFSKKRKVATFSIILILSLFVLFIVYKGRGFHGSGRIEGYIAAIIGFVEHPFLGNGLAWTPNEATIPHNFFLQYLSQLGLFFTIFLSLFLSKVIYLVSKENKILLLNMLVLIFGSMFIPDIINSRFFILMILFSILSITQEDKSNKLCVAHLMSSGGYSGAEAVAISIIHNTPSNWDSVYVSPSGPIENILKKESINHISNQELFRPSATTQKVDLVYAHDFKASLKASSSINRAKVISHIHQNPTWFSKFSIKSLMFLAASIFIDEIVFVSQETMNEFVFKGLIRNKSRWISNYVDAEKVVKSSKKFKVSNNYDLSYLGRLDEVKNPLGFIDVIAILKKSLPDIQAVMIGDGLLRTDVESKIKHENLCANIHLVGYQSNPYPYVLKSKINVITSHWEGFGLSAVEAMILGVPVVSTNVGGLKTVVNDEGGYICDSIATIASTILYLITNTDKMESLRVSSKKSSLRFTDTQVWKNNIYDLFTKLENGDYNDR